MSKVEWNISREDEELSDADLPADPPGYVPTAPEEDSSEQDVLYVSEEAIDQLLNEEEEELDDSKILSNARLRLEQGRLYEMLMSHNIFENLDADPKAMKNVQREIKRFAKERMEVMLGMRQTLTANPPRNEQFNQLEVTILKTLAGKLSGGQSVQEKTESSSPKSTTLAPLGTPKATVVKNQKLKNVLSNKFEKPKAQKVDKKPEPTPAKPAAPKKDIKDMTYDEKIAYNQERSAIYDARKVQNPVNPPMTVEMMNTIYAGRANSVDKMFDKIKKG